MNEFQFARAERKKAKLRLALCGPSGSGKTFSALLIAKGIGGKVAVIDTERGSAELYAGNATIGMDYDVLQLSPPYTPARYVQAIKAAHKAGYAVCIIDSLSHAWSGEGGELEMAEMGAKSKGGNKWAGWADVRPEEKKFLDALTGIPIHMIATMRTKTAWEIQEENGKKKPIKIGLAPEQKAGIEYEFTVVFDLSVDGNVATASKDRTDNFKGKHFVPGPETGSVLLAWLNSGAESPTPAPPDNDPLGAGVGPGSLAGQSRPEWEQAKAQPKAADKNAIAQAREQVRGWLAEDHDGDPDKIASRLTDLVGEYRADVGALSVDELRKTWAALGGKKRIGQEREAA